ncbi:apolipoprotein D-like [Cimex lectularius]|uniref:Apolipoprotein D n=1 Tax=Cimex lectularius TaxID=79782 RepID=A0A8I6RCW9_CIMLE|nr:apolipoprotein D-like [Cimex lectularius]
MSNCQKSAILFILALLLVKAYQKKEDKTKCPVVKGSRNFNIDSFLGSWYVVQYYATSEEDIMYKCMRAVFYMSDKMGLAMNFTYSFADDPENEILYGNITWVIPDTSQPSHWIHAEDIYEGIYNTYVLDCNDSSWSLLLHCAEKRKSPRYLTSLLLSRNTTLPQGVISFLRDKLPRYDINLDYMFDMTQSNCEEPTKNLHYASKKTKSSKAKHPLKRKARLTKSKTAKQRAKSN